MPLAVSIMNHGHGPGTAPSAKFCATRHCPHKYTKYKTVQQKYLLALCEIYSNVTIYHEIKAFTVDKCSYFWNFGKAGLNFLLINIALYSLKCDPAYPCPALIIPSSTNGWQCPAYPCLARVGRARVGMQPWSSQAAPMACQWQCAWAVLNISSKLIRLIKLQRGKLKHSPLHTS